MTDLTLYNISNARIFHEEKIVPFDFLGDISPSRRLLLECKEGHKWNSSRKVLEDNNGVQCPYCSGKKVIPGVNDSATLHSFLSSQWDVENNGGIIPNNLKDGSHKNAYWICSSGHSFIRSIRDNIKKNGSCPYCTGFYAIPGETDVATVCPRILNYWDDSINDDELKTLLPQSNKRVNLRCPKYHDHVWNVSIQTFVVKNISCPFCSNKKVLKGFNDIATTNPELAKMWGDNKIKPTEVTHGSGETIEWICSKGHKWKAKINNVYSRGSRCPFCSNNRVLRGFNDFFTVAPQNILEEWDYDKNDVLPTEIVAKSCKKIYWKCENGHPIHRWIALPKDRIYGIGNCRICFYGISNAEHEIFKYIESICNEDVIQSNRSIINPYELDIYIPDHNLAIEFNGLYWHTENQGKDKRYHYNKWKQCKDKGIQLITIWEDEWRDKRDIIKSMLAHKLGVSHSPKVYARKTTLAPLSSPQARSFLDSYHIQGFARSTAYFGLYDSNNTLVAVSSWRKNKNTLYLDRYATSCSVIGGMGKMLKKGKEIAREYGCTKIVTFADHQVSNGLLYEKLGFTLDKELSPDYRYLVDEERKHKFGYRITRFKNDPYLKYKEGLSESQLAKINGIKKIWDCGKSRYIIRI